MSIFKNLNYMCSKELVFYVFLMPSFFQRNLEIYFLCGLFIQKIKYTFKVIKRY